MCALFAQYKGKYRDYVCNVGQSVEDYEEWLEV